MAYSWSYGAGDGHKCSNWHKHLQISVVLSYQPSGRIFKKKVESVKNKSLHDREFKGCLSIHQSFGFQQQCFLILQLSVLWPTLCISCRYISSIIAKEWFQSRHSRTILIMNCQLWPEREVFLSALTTVLSARLTKGRSFPLLWVTVKNSCPTLAKCSCYLDPGGQAASHLCPFTS